jgi:hypothetical protein
MVNPQLILVNHFRNQGLKGATHQIESVLGFSAQHVAYRLVRAPVVHVNAQLFNA